MFGHPDANPVRQHVSEILGVSRHWQDEKTKNGRPAKALISDRPLQRGAVHQYKHVTDRGLSENVLCKLPPIPTQSLHFSNLDDCFAPSFWEKTLGWLTGISWYAYWLWRMKWDCAAKIILLFHQPTNRKRTSYAGLFCGKTKYSGDRACWCHQQIWQRLARTIFSMAKCETSQDVACSSRWRRSSLVENWLKAAEIQASGVWFGYADSIILVC